MGFIKSLSVPIADLKKHSKIFFEILEKDNFLRVAETKKALVFEDENKIYFFTQDKELYFYVKRGGEQ